MIARMRREVECRRYIRPPISDRDTVPSIGYHRFASIPGNVALGLDRRVLFVRRLCRYVSLEATRVRHRQRPTQSPLARVRRSPPVDSYLGLRLLGPRGLLNRHAALDRGKYSVHLKQPRRRYPPDDIWVQTELEQPATFLSN